MAMELRPYQKEAVERVEAEWASGNTKTLIVMATGLGKTVTFAAITAAEVSSGSRVLILAHRGELLEQAADKIYKTTGLRCAVEKAEQSSLGSFFRVTVGSVQSLQRSPAWKNFLKTTIRQSSSTKPTTRSLTDIKRSSNTSMVLSCWVSQRHPTEATCEILARCLTAVLSNTASTRV